MLQLPFLLLLEIWEWSSSYMKWSLVASIQWMLSYDLPVQRATILGEITEAYAVKVNGISCPWHDLSTNLVSFVLIQVRERNFDLCSPNAFKPIRPLYLLQLASTLCSLEVALPLVVEWKKLAEGVAVEISLPYDLNEKHTQSTTWRRKEDMEIKVMGKKMLKTEEEQQRYRSTKEDKKRWGEQLVQKSTWELARRYKISSKLEPGLLH